jgi:NAD(P)-dependent dehydrogenase (short-subunit alcohol dehydrogenase family)
VSELAVVTGAAGGIGAAVAARLAADGFAVRGLDRADGDLTTEAGIAAAFAGLPGAYALVHCVGITAGAPAHETSLADWRAVLDANLTSAFLCARAVLPAMMAAGRAVTVSPGWVRTADTAGRLTDPADLARLAETQRLGEPEDVAAAVSFVVSDAAALLTGTEIVLDGGASAFQTAALLRPGPRRRLGLPPLHDAQPASDATDPEAGPVQPACDATDPETGPVQPGCDAAGAKGGSGQPACDATGAEGGSAQPDRDSGN